MFPFAKFAGVDTILGPEMRSTGEVMGIDTNFAPAFGKSQIGAGTQAADERAACSCRCRTATRRARSPSPRGSSTSASRSSPPTARTTFLTSTRARRQARQQGARGAAAHRRPLLDGDIHLVINTTAGAQAIKDSFSIRRTALLKGIPYYTTLSAARAAVGAIAELRSGKMTVRSLQEYQNG